MGTPGHMAHPFGDEDHPSLWQRVRTGQDLLQYFHDIKEFLELNPGSLKTDGINVSFKLITTKDGQKEFRMDRGTTHTESVVGMTAEDAYEKWPEGHGMPHAIKTLLEIFNEALPSIQYELKDLGMWDNPQKFFNTEYVEGKTNVQQYDKNFLAIHGINQFYEKKAPKSWVAAGKSMDRKGLERPTNPKTGKLVKDTGVEITYNRGALESLIKKVKPIASQRGFEIYGDIPTQLIAEIDYTETLGSPFTIQMTAEEQTTHSLSEWLEEVHNPKNEKVTKADGTTVPAIGKDVYMAVTKHIPLTEYLKSPEDVKKAVSGAIFNHATRMLGNDVKSALDSSMGSVADHEGVVLRGMEDFPVKVTGEFIVGGMQTAFREGMIKEAEELKGIKDVEEMYNIETVNPDIPEAKRKIALIPGGFKPPHRGHLALVTHYLDEVTPDGKVILYMGSGGDTPRTIHGKTITFEDALRIWKIYLNNENIAFPNNFLEIKEVEGGPIGAAIDYIKEADPDKEIIYLGAGEKDSERWKFMIDDLKYNPNKVKIFIEPVPNYQDSEGKPMSATNFRDALESGDEELIKSYIPEESHDSYREIMDTFESRLKESQQPLGIFLRLIEETLNEKENLLLEWPPDISTPPRGPIPPPDPPTGPTNYEKRQLAKKCKTCREEAFQKKLEKVKKDFIVINVIGKENQIYEAFKNAKFTPWGIMQGYSVAHQPTKQDIIDYLVKKIHDTQLQFWSVEKEKTEMSFSPITDNIVIPKNWPHAKMKLGCGECQVPDLENNFYATESFMHELGHAKAQWLCSFIRNHGRVCNHYDILALAAPDVYSEEYNWKLINKCAKKGIIRGDHTIDTEHGDRVGELGASVGEFLGMAGRSVLLPEDIIIACLYRNGRKKDARAEARWAKKTHPKDPGKQKHAYNLLTQHSEIFDKMDCNKCSTEEMTNTLQRVAQVIARDAPRGVVSENFLNIIEETIDEATVGEMFGFASGRLESITPGGFDDTGEEEATTAEEVVRELIVTIGDAQEEATSVEDVVQTLMNAILKAAEDHNIDIEDEEEELEETSTMGGASSEIASVPFKRHDKKKKKKQTSLIREVEDYLFKMLGVSL